MVKIVVLTGAGISAESGLKTFRDSDGLWEQYRIEDVATPEAFRANPELVLEFYNMRRKQTREAKPNAAHIALAEFEKLITKNQQPITVQIVTQNIDDLHERAGSKNVMHLHGEILKSRSSFNHQLVYDCIDDIRFGDKCEKGSQLRPHIVWFGEAVPMLEFAEREVMNADAVIVVGTSLNVYPAAGLVYRAVRGIPVLVVDPNIPPTPGLQNVISFPYKATEGVPKAIEKLLELL
jgi:NAD-dependent deacetylase